MTFSFDTLALHDVPPLLAFLAAILLIDSYDISRPRGDSISMSGPLLAALLVEFGWVSAMLLGLFSTVAIQLARRLRNQESALLDEVLVRVAATSLAGVVYLLSNWAGVTRLEVLTVPATYLAAELFGRQALLAIRAHRSLGRLLAGNVSRQAMLFAAQLSVSALTVLTYESLGLWAMIPVVALLLLMRQAYSMLLEIRETYLTTVGVLVEAAESQSADIAGHSDRTAEIARRIGSRCGLSTSEIERLSYAALLHDIGRISDTPEDGGSHPDSASMVADIAFFNHVRIVLQILDGLVDPAAANEHDLLVSYIVALASDIDASRHVAASFGQNATSVSLLSASVPSRLKAQVVSGAVAAGYSLPAID